MSFENIKPIKLSKRILFKSPPHERYKIDEKERRLNDLKSELLKMHFKSKRKEKQNKKVIKFE